jgi:conjugal transfer pilus assembly protein TrbC
MLPAGAAEPAWPSQESIDRVRKDRPFPDAQAIERAPIPLPPRVDAPGAGPDIEALVRKHTGTATPSREQPVQSALRVFVTLDMPAASLKGLADQAARSGAVLVLRGLKNGSMRTTLTTVQALIGDRQVAWQIDPEAFKHFGVERAPTFVLLTGGTASFVAVAGDVSLDFALHAMVRQAPAASPYAQPFLTRLKDSR